MRFTHDWLLTLLFLHRHILNEADVNNSLMMIQPTLMSYTSDVPPQPVLLDNVSIKPDVILLDAFFHIHFFYGSTFTHWRRAGYQNHEGTRTLRIYWSSPLRMCRCVSRTSSIKIDSLLMNFSLCQELLANCFPILHYIICDQGHIQACFLLSKLNLLFHTHVW